MKATLKQIQGTTFAAKADSNHWTVIDNSPEDDGSGAGGGPMEMVLMALGSCSAVDIWLILKKMRAKVSDFQINLEGERRDEHPRVFTKVHLEYLFRGEDLKEKDIERAIQLSLDTYCSVAGMVGKTAEIKTSYKILKD
ncbi:MAG: osmotically inducible protein OsmC [Caldithrix sp.]|nr:MAG: osmotically inducible protein OsmC [Caldithrix sp.]TDI98622.1 MAG: osmotically inducible protein OsmC [Caldithrix sp.]